MAIALEPRTGAALDVSRFLFEGVSWDDYEAMLQIIGDRPIRANYDGESLELMSPILRHGRSEDLLGLMVWALCEEIGVPIEGAGMVTLKHPEIRKGVEPDRSFFLREHAALVRGKDRLVRGIDPPPDLIIEVEVTSSVLDRMGIFAALGIPEIWRLDGAGLHFEHLRDDGRYEGRAASRAFPYLSVAELWSFLERATPMDKALWIRSFRAFVRDVLAPRAAGGMP